MGRNKYKAPLDNAERKRMKNGDYSLGFGAETTSRVLPQGGGAWTINHTEDSTGTRGLAKRRGPRQSQTSDNSWVHAVLFVVLAAIVISWALGY